MLRQKHRSSAIRFGGSQKINIFLYFKMKKKFKLKSRALIGEYKKRLIKDIVEDKNKKEIFNFIKEGYDVDDEVLEAIGIKKYIGEKKAKCVFVDHIKDDVKYEKEEVPIKKVLGEISTLENDEEPTNEENSKNDTGYDTYSEFN